MSGDLSKIVIVESPYNSEVSDSEIAMNIIYARACVTDCLVRGEVPFASHLFYTQPGVLDDKVALDRERGIKAGLKIASVADLSVVYLDRGISKGMKYGIENAQKAGRPIEERVLGNDWYEKFLERIEGHSQKEVWELSCK